MNRESLLRFKFLRLSLQGELLLLCSGETFSSQMTKFIGFNNCYILL